MQVAWSMPIAEHFLVFLCFPKGEYEVQPLGNMELRILYGNGRNTDMHTEYSLLNWTCMLSSVLEYVFVFPDATTLQYPRHYDILNFLKEVGCSCGPYPPDPAGLFHANNNAVGRIMPF